jgi:sugar-specific transcriptional regulator TrmB
MALSDILYRLLLPTFISNKNQKLLMLTKKESDKTTTRFSAENDTIGVETSTSTTSTTSSSSSLSGQRHSVEMAIEETKDNLKKTIDEARREIPRNTEAINDYQEHTLQTTKEITDSYLDSQKEIIKSFQSIWVPYVENMRTAFWDNWASPQRITEIYARTVSNCADNVVATTRIANNAIFANVSAYRTFIDREKNDVKELSRIAANTAKTFEQTTRDTTANASVPKYGSSNFR